MPISRISVVSLALFSFAVPLSQSQTREKRIAPVDASQRQNFDKQVKVALLVGIGAYPQGSGIGPLKYPARDVAQLAAELERQGYLVRRLVDSGASRGLIRRTLAELADTINPDQGTLIFYYSGHGFADGGTNYLATFGATIDDLKREGLAVSDVPLANSVNDARGMAAALRESGFQVQELEDADLRGIEQSVAALIASTEAGDVVLFYYSGHGLQIDGENYLVPVSFRATTETDAKYESYPVARIGDALMERGARLKILILDACRDNPFRASRSASHGLAVMNSARGLFLVFATDPGRTADDNPAGGNGLFTKHLLDALRVPGLSLDEVFSRVRAGVDRESGGRQVPWTASSVVGDFVFRPGGAAVPTQPAPGDQSLEITYWNSIKDSKNPALFQAYLGRFPNGSFREIAEAELVQIKPVLQTQRAPEMKQFSVMHWHDSRTGVKGRLWVGNGKVEFQEHGEGEDAEHSFSLACSSISDVTTDSGYHEVPGKKKKGEFRPASTAWLKVSTQKPLPYFSVDSPNTGDEVAALIKSMCEPVWFQQATPKKK